MKASFSFPALALLVAITASTFDVRAQEGDVFTGRQAIDESASEVPSATQPKGALEKGGETLGQTAPLNADRASGPNAQSQSSKPESMKITRSIRQQINERADLSTSAKNVKIITDDKGAVTLRGPVKTDNEKQALEQIARNNAQGGTVHNQIVVKGEEASRGAAHG